MKQTKILFSQAKAVNRKADNVTGMEQPVSIALSNQNFFTFPPGDEKNYTFLPGDGKKQARKLQDAQAVKLTSWKADKLTG